MSSQENQEVRFGLGVSLAIFNKSLSKILLLKRNPEKVRRWGVEWGNIGGAVEKRELSIAAAVREAREETLLEINKKNVKLMEIIEIPNFTEAHHGIHFAYATTLDESAPIKINEESLEFKWFDLDSLPNSMFDSKEVILGWKEKILK